MKKKIIAIVACVAIIAAGIGLYFYVNPLSTNNSENVPTPTVSANGKTDKTKDNSKTITLTISADGKTETYEVKTDAETLGKMLVDEGYVKTTRKATVFTSRQFTVHSKTAGRLTPARKNGGA